LKFFDHIITLGSISLVPEIAGDELIQSTVFGFRQHFEILLI